MKPIRSVPREAFPSTIIGKSPLRNVQKKRLPSIRLSVRETAIEHDADGFADFGLQLDLTSRGCTPRHRLAQAGGVTTTKPSTT